MQALARVGPPSLHWPEDDRGAGVEADRKRAEASQGADVVIAAIARAAQLNLQGDPAALDAAALAVELADQRGDPPLRLSAIECRAECEQELGSFDVALRCIGDAIGQAQAIEDTLSEARSRCLLATQLKSLGQIDRGLEEAMSALTLAERQGDLATRALAHWSVAKLHMPGRVDMAREHLEQSLALSRQSGAAAIEARALNTLANLYNVIGQRLEAAGDLSYRVVRRTMLDLHRQAVPIFERLGESRMHAMTMLNVANAHIGMDEPHLALAIVETQLQEARGAGRRRAEEYALRLLGGLHHDLGDRRSAVETWQQAAKAAAEIGEVALEAESHDWASRVYEQMGEPAEALRHARTSHQLKEKMANGVNERRAMLDRLRSDLVRMKEEADTARLRASRLEAANADLAVTAERLAEESARDPLTGLFNRRRLERALRVELARRDASMPYSIALIDIDHFKRINDRHSHLIGDEVLKQVATIVRDVCRQDDFAVRYGGEEFAVIFPRLSADKAIRACERLRMSVQAHDWQALSPGLAVSASIGVADNRVASSPDDVLSEADRRLYEAKDAGRNCTIGEKQPA